MFFKYFFLGFGNYHGGENRTGSQKIQIKFPRERAKGVCRTRDTPGHSGGCWKTFTSLEGNSALSTE